MLSADRKGGYGFKYIHFTEEQKERANATELAGFLLGQGEKLIASGRDKRLEADHSITIRDNKWYDHATGKGGLAIDFVKMHYGLSFPDAVSKLLDEEWAIGVVCAGKDEVQEKKAFALPPRSSDMRRMLAYLTKHRLVGRDVVMHFVKTGLIYESLELSKDQTRQYHNTVFVGFDEHGAARHAHKRSVYSAGRGYRGNVEGSDPLYSFHYSGVSERLYVFEGPVDMLSFITLHPQNWNDHSYVSLCGVAEHAMLKMLEMNPVLQRIFLCLDNDAPGHQATERLGCILEQKGYGQTEILRPAYKDWNEDIKAANGRSAVLAESDIKQGQTLQSAEMVLQ